MHDIKAIRDNPEAFDAALARRGLDPMSEGVLQYDLYRRAAVTKEEEARAKRTTLSQEIGKLKKMNLEVPEKLLEEAQYLGGVINDHNKAATCASDKLNACLATIPNLPSATAPDGADESANIEFMREGVGKEATPPHDEIARSLGLYGAETAVAMSGERFTMLHGHLATLERAIGNFMLDRAINHGFEEISPPLIVNTKTMFGTGQLPKFAADLYRLHDTDQWLIPTGEVPLTNIVAGKIIPAEQLPLHFCALTPCFRAEAGSAGRDTTGLIRQHQFYKVEMVSITAGDETMTKMLQMATETLDFLELPWRVVELCTGDLGFSAAKTYDIEVWFPSQQRYREISSISDCGDFQARRMNARTKVDGKTQFLRTGNGSGVAVGRALAALIETHWDGKVLHVPEVLHRYTGFISIGE